MSEKSLAERRMHRVRGHMQSEIVHDFEATIATFDHPRYELYGHGQVFDGAEAVMGYFKTSRTAFPDQANEVISLKAADDSVFVEFWLTGTHKGAIKTLTGELQPTGKSFRVRVAAVFEFPPDSDKIVCERVYFDQTAILKQLTS